MSKQSLHTNEMVDSAEDFENMYESHAPLIYRFMFWRTKDSALSQDLTSNVFEKAWKTRKSFIGGSTQSWLYRIARTTLIDYWRKKKDLTIDEASVAAIVSDTEPLSETLDRDMRAAELQTAVAKLPTDMQHIIELRFMQGLSSKQVAARLDLSEANVRVIQYRALKKLKGYLQ